MPRSLGNQLRSLAITEVLETGLAGLEPTAYGLGNRRSIRLSYSPISVIIAFGLH